MKLNPLTKFLTVIVYCVLLFLIDEVYLLIILCAPPLVLYLHHFKVSKFIVMFSIIIFFLNVLFISGDILYKIEYSLRIVLRFLGVVVSGLLFSKEDPNEFAHALMKVGLPYRYGMTMVLTFRLIPLFSSESMMIRKAQMARGVDLEGVSSLINLIKFGGIIYMEVGRQWWEAVARRYGEKVADECMNEAWYKKGGAGDTENDQAQLLMNYKGNDVGTAMKIYQLLPAMAGRAARTGVPS